MIVVILPQGEPVEASVWTVVAVVIAKLAAAYHGLLASKLAKKECTIHGAIHCLVFDQWRLGLSVFFSRCKVTNS